MLKLPHLISLDVRLDQLYEIFIVSWGRPVLLKTSILELLLLHPIDLGMSCFHFRLSLVCCCCSVTQSCPTLCNPMASSRPALCPSPSHKVYPSSSPLHWWWHPVISSSDALFSFCPQSFPASGTFPMSQLFASDDQNTGVSASVLVLPTSIQGWFPCCPRDSGVFSSTTV